MIWFPNSEYSKMFASIQDDPTLRAEYDYYPSAFDFGLAVWRGAEKYEIMNEAIAKVWHEVYPGFDMEEARFTFQ